MDLNEQAGAAVDALLAEVGITLGDDAHRAAKMLWLDGFKAGMDATKKMHDDAFATMRPRHEHVQQQRHEHEQDARGDERRRGHRESQGCTMSDRVEHACDRCDASAWFLPSEKLTIGLGCDCGGAWIMLDAQGPMLGEPSCDFPTLGVAS